MLRLRCRHGHEFDIELNLVGKVACPLCGSLREIKGTVESSDSVAATIQVPGQDEDTAATRTFIEEASHDDYAATVNFPESNSSIAEIDPPKEPPSIEEPAEDSVSTISEPSDAADDAGAFQETVTFQQPDAKVDSNVDQSDDVNQDSNDQPSADGTTQAGPRTTAPMQTEATLTEPPNLPGYNVLDALGRGGMGVVYRALDEKPGREVAIKTLQRISPIELQRFKQEFRSLADIAHPNLATLYDLVSDGQTWCFTMEILEAVEFLEYVWSEFDKLDEHSTPTAAVNENPRLSDTVMKRLCDGVQQLAFGLNALHAAGVLHRDIKPSNVLVTREGRVVLVDFGLAADMSDSEDENAGSIQGTPVYMAPEQAAGQPMSPASDWYAVGVMLYELLTGSRPIDGKLTQIIFKKQTTDPPPPQELNAGISDELNDLCVRLLDRDAAKRPSVEEVLRSFDGGDLIGQLRGTTIARSTQSTELVSREPHLRTLRDSFSRVLAGTTQSIFIHGRSGMGKSVLIQTFLEKVREQDALVLTGRCYEQESVPFKALDSLIDSLATNLGKLAPENVADMIPEDSLPLVRLFPVLGQVPGMTDAGKPSIENVDQQELRQRAMNALRELLTRLGTHHPIALYIDDLQWGDEDSADLLADLLRPPNSPRVMLLGSYRSENVDTSACLKALDAAWKTGQHHPHREELAVESLTEEQSTQLALMLLERDDQETQEIAAKIARESGGWPFFVWELAQHVQEDPDIADQSLGLDEVIWTRVNRLPEETRQLLELFAVAARPTPADEAWKALEFVDQGRGLLAQLRASHFVRTTESEDSETIVETYHDRIRESVVDHLDDQTVRRYNLQLAETIEQVSGFNAQDFWQHIERTAEFEEPGEPYVLEKRQWQRVFDLAQFFDAAGHYERAFPFALAAAERARQQDAQEVPEQQYRIALRAIDQVKPHVRFRLLEGLGDVLVLRARYVEANEQFEAARSLATGDQVLARIDWKQGVASFKKADMANARDFLERSIRALGERPPTKLSVVPRFIKEAIVQVLHTKFPSMFVGRNTTDSKQGQLDLFRARVYDQLTISYWFTRGMKFVLWSHLRQMNLAKRYPATQELGKTYAFHAVVMTGLPLAERGIAYAERAYKISEDDSFRWGQGKARCYHTFSCIVNARFQEGVRTGSEVVRLLEEAGDVWEANMARMIMSVPMYHAGDLKGAYREAKKAYEIGIETGDFSAACISLLFWVPAAPHTIPPGAIQTELERDPFDPLAITGAIFARGLELLSVKTNPKRLPTNLRKCCVKPRGENFAIAACLPA